MKRIFLTFILIVAVISAMSISTVLAAEQPTIPEKTDYTIEETVVGGDFEIFEAGQMFGTSSPATYQWGTNIAYDYPAQVVEENGNNILKLTKGIGDKPYSSAFVFVSNSFNIGEFMTVEFEYKLDVASMTPYSAENLSAVEKTINFSFAPASGADHHIIVLDGTRPAVTTGENQYKWPVTYSEGENGVDWTKVSLTLSVNAGTIIANSIRWLMPITAQTDPADAMYIDNVSILHWIDNSVEDLRPVLVSGDNSIFNKNNPEDITIVINTKGEELNNIKRGTTNVNAVAFTKTVDGENVTVVLKQDYLKSLEVGTHIFNANTIEGTVSFELTIEEKSVEKGCGIINIMDITLIFGLMVTVFFSITYAVIKVKKNRNCAA